MSWPFKCTVPIAISILTDTHTHTCVREFFVRKKKRSIQQNLLDKIFFFRKKELNKLQRQRNCFCSFVIVFARAICRCCCYCVELWINRTTCLHWCRSLNIKSIRHDVFGSPKKKDFPNRWCWYVPYYFSRTHTRSSFLLHSLARSLAPSVI